MYICVCCAFFLSPLLCLPPPLLKAEMSALLCRHSTFSADLAHADRLQANLRQRDSEIMRLNDKIRKLGKEIQDKKVRKTDYN